MSAEAAPSVRWPVRAFRASGVSSLDDQVAGEEVLEILLAAQDSAESGEPWTITLRTPGEDEDLVAGLLYAEGLVRGAGDIAAIRPLPGSLGENGQRVDRLLVVLRRLPTEGLPASTRRTASSAACGACGRSSAAGVFAGPWPPLLADEPRVARALLQSLPARMRERQKIFTETGGLHAAALFSAAGELLLLREDVGRHNAVDKVVGALLSLNQLPATRAILAVSGRAGAEIVHKALRAGLPMIAAVGAPASLALRLAQQGGLTLAGFLRGGGFNLYTHPRRIASEVSGLDAFQAPASNLIQFCANLPEV